MGKTGDDEIQLGEFRFIVAPSGVKQGERGKGTYMRWWLRSENGVTILLMNRAQSHRTQPNAMVLASSLPLMQFGLEAVWGLTQHVFDAIGSHIVANKVSRVDACVDLADVPVSEFTTAYREGWRVTRARHSAEYENGLPIGHYYSHARPTGFYVGKFPMSVRVYDKLVEVAHKPEKLALLVANRWGYLPEHATRVELEFGRQRLKDYGVNSWADWLAKRGAICDTATRDWFRLTAGPVDRQHADRAGIHPVWERARAAFAAWCGSTGNVSLTPLSQTGVDVSQQFASLMGMLKSCLARVGRQIDSNEEFLREVSLAVREAIRNRDMADEVRRRALELGLG